MINTMKQVFRCSRNEKRPVQPHKVEIHVGLAQPWVRLGQGGYGLAVDEDWTRHRARCQTMSQRLDVEYMRHLDTACVFSNFPRARVLGLLPAHSHVGVNLDMVCFVDRRK